MEERFAVEGFVVDELIGFGGTGEVWRAHDLETGEVVALKRLRQRGPGAIERLRREGALLASVAGPHVIALRRLVGTSDEAVLVMDYAAGGNLAGLLAVRRTLPAAEVVTILAPLAAALAAAHSRDLVHGDLTPANVVFASDGRPLLADFGVARVVGRGAGATDSSAVEGTVDFLDPAVIAGAEVTAASDIYALGAVGYAALSGRSPRGDRPLLAAVAPGTPAALVLAIEGMLRADPFDRPDARSAQHAVLRSGPAAPVGLVHRAAPVAVPVTEPVRRPPTSADAEPARKARRIPRRVLTVAVAAVALVAAAAMGVGWAQLGGHGRAGALAALPSRSETASSTPTAVEPSLTPTVTPTTTATTTTPTPTGQISQTSPPWLAIVTRLEQLRAEAYADGVVGLLADVYVPGAAAYQADLATIRSLASRGLRADGFTATVKTVWIESSTATSAKLHVVDALSGYTLVDPSGAVSGRGAPRPDRAFTMTVTKRPTGWLVDAITPIATAASTPGPGQPPDS